MLPDGRGSRRSLFYGETEKIRFEDFEKYREIRYLGQRPRCQSISVCDAARVLLHRPNLLVSGWKKREKALAANRNQEPLIGRTRLPAPPPTEPTLLQ